MRGNRGVLTGKSKEGTFLRVVETFGVFPKWQSNKKTYKVTDLRCVHFHVCKLDLIKYCLKIFKMNSYARRMGELSRVIHTKMANIN